MVLSNRQKTWDRLSALWADPDILTLETQSQKYVLISDLHLGDGGESDDFFRNQVALLRALEYYQRQGFSLILLGDIEEFWQFDLDQIAACYDQTVYAAMRAFGDERLIRVFGNHDREWAGLKDPARQQGAQRPLAEEAVKLTDQAGRPCILLVHGHQGSADSDKYSWFSRFFVRLFRGIEPLVRRAGLYGHPSATMSSVPKNFERTIYLWAKQNRVVVICGHSHRAIFASRSFAQRLMDEIASLRAEVAAARISRQKREQKLRLIAQKERQLEEEKEKDRLIEALDPDRPPLPCYFNTGCGLYTDGITVLEIENGEIRLVKWSRDALEPPFHEIYARGSLAEFVKAVADQPSGAPQASEA